MMQAIRTFQVVCLNFQFSSTPTRNVLKIKSKNNTPCTGPICLTQSGS